MLNQKKITNIIAFGDSNTDTGNAYIVSKKVLELPSPPPKAVLKPIPGSWCKRASNGPLSVEILASKLCIPLLNYSIGGAGTNEKNIFSWMNTFSDTGYLGQIQKYKEYLGGRRPLPTDLYIIYIGGNTLFTYRPPITIDEATTLGVNDIKKGIQTLIDIGAKRFIVFNLLDISLTPYAIEKNQVEVAKEFTLLMNKKIKDISEEFQKQPSITLTLYDLNRLINNIATYPSNYGIKHISVQCHPAYPDTVPQKFYPCMACNCLFWDDYHVTWAVNKLIANELYMLVKRVYGVI